jgi:phosphatidylglycerol:prolipoprotein diacylglycerol transferase
MMMTKIKEFFSKSTDARNYTIGFTAFIIVLLLAILTQDGTPYNPTALDLGFAQVQWYAVFILTGLSIAAFLAYEEFKRVGWNPDLLFDALLWAVPLSIVGSRLYYVIFDPNPNYDTFMDVINITNGGLSIHGAVITAFIFVFFFTRKKKISFWLLADILAVGFLIGQIVGRWGNFMNQEAYGPQIQSEFILSLLPPFIEDQMVIGGIIHHPTYLYEGLWNFAGLIFLLVARRKRWFKVGDMMGLYLIWYGLGRGAIIEPLRTGGDPGDALRMFGLPTNVILSLTLFMLGGAALIVAKHYLIKDQKYYLDMLVTSHD